MWIKRNAADNPWKACAIGKQRADGALATAFP